MMQKFETRNDIKTRILKEAAREWGYRGVSDIDLDGFDPVVDMLVGACSFELEKLSNDITNSRNRIFERLIEILTPDSMTQAQPAHAIVHALPTEHMYITQETDQLFTKNIENNQDIYFSPAGRFRLMDARVEYMAYDHKMFKVNERLEKDQVLEATYGNYFQKGTCYIGLKISDQIKSLKDFTFYLDWKNEVRIHSLLKLLPLSRWSIGERDIRMRSGYNLVKEKSTSDDLLSNIGIDKYVDSQVLTSYKKNYLTCEEEVDILANKARYPQHFIQIFGEEAPQQVLKEKLLWLKVTLPHSIGEKVADMTCLLNCVPVLNRQWHEKQERLSDELPIIPIEVGSQHFLCMDEVTNSSGTDYKEVPLKIVDQSDHGMFAIRSRGVNRFDSREAKHLLTYAMDMVREETVAFKGLGYSTLESDLQEMSVLFNRMKKNFKRSEVDVSNTTFLFAKPFPNDDLVYVKYWTTDGELGNRIPAGTPLKIYSNSDINPKSLQLVTTTKLGRDALQPVESINAFKEALITRGRIVTHEDIKIFCTNTLGHRNIENIDVRKGVAISHNEKEGLIRTIDIHITRKTPHQIGEQEWLKLCNEAEASLEERSTGILPLRIISQ